MDIYKMMYEVIQSKDLLYSGQKLIEFADVIYRERNRATLVKLFYQHLYEYALVDYVFDNMLDNSRKRYYICEESNATGMYIALALPGEKTPVKSLNEIRSFGEQILTYYTNPVGKGISKTSLENILQFLDEQYSFSSKVFAKQKTAFILMPYSHKNYNSECLVINTGKGVVQHFFLYHMRKKGKTAPNPETVLFHELGHAMHARRFGSITQVPENILDLLQSICFPRIKQISAAQQSEVFADVLSIGLMYQTPFEIYDPFRYIHPNDKVAFKMITEKLLVTL